MLLLYTCFNLQHRYFGNNEFIDTKLLYNLKEGDFQTYDQTADHFNQLDNSTFKQRYLVNDTFYKQGGPLLLFIGGEGTMSDKELQGKYSINYFAQQLNGFMVSLEHRYYGESQPFANMSNMSLLSSRQALADCVEFIYFIKNTYNLTGSKVIAIGGSYSGNLAAWLREKYPHAVDIAISSSAPYFAKLDFPEYLNHSSEQFKVVGNETCYQQLMNVLQYGTQLLRNNSEKFAQLMQLKTGQLPQNMTDQDIATVEQAFWDYPTGLVQYHKAAGFNGSEYQGDIQQFCTILLNKTQLLQTLDDQLKAYGEIVKLNTYGDLSFSASKQLLENVTAPNDGRAWTYQTCAEFGYYQTSELVPAYGIENSLDYWVQLCQNVFYGNVNSSNGSIASQLISQTNRHYGARNLRRDQIIITNGGVDPWSQLSIQLNSSWATGQRIPNDAGVIFIDYGSHCSDMYLDWSSNDNVRKQQLSYLQRWLNINETQNTENII